MSGVIHVLGEAQLNQQLRAENRLVVVDWSAPWCGPCVRIAPEYERLARLYTNGTFLSVNTEEPSNKMANLPAKYGIRAFPTFTFHLNGQEIERFSGASPQKLESTITRLLVRAEDEQLAAAIKLSMSSSEAAQEGKDAKGGAAAAAEAEAASFRAAIQAAEAADPEPTGGDELTIKLKRITGETRPVKINSKASVQHLRRKVAVELDASLASVRLIFHGKILKDGSSLASCGIAETDLTVHVAVSMGSAKPAAQPAAAPSGSAGAASAAELKLRRALGDLEARNTRQQARDAVQVIQLYVRNIVTHPEDVKYRSIRVGNAKFSSKVASCSGGTECMLAIGFEHKDRDGEAYLVLNSACNAEEMTRLRDELARFAEKLAPHGVPSAAPVAEAIAPSAFGGAPAGPGNPFAAFTDPSNNFGSMFGQLPGGGMPAGGFPGMPGVDPAMLQAFQNNPQLRNAAQGMSQRLMQDPQLMSTMMQAMSSGQDPMTTMLSNPSLMQSMMEMMSDPSMRSALGGLSGMMPGMMPGAMPGAMPGMGGFGAAPAAGTSASAAPAATSSGSAAASGSSSTAAAPRREGEDAEEGEDDLDDLDDIYAD